jgi:hypothetical protein
MKLIEIFNQLTHGELSQLHIGGAELGKIQEEDYPKLVSHVNLALAALYRRFPLKEGRLTLAIQPGQSAYSLLSTYAVSSRRSRAPIRYIEDSMADPFEDDINKVERVLKEDGTELPLNIEGDEDSCFTPSFNVLRIPKSLETGKLEVVYRAVHPQIVIPMGPFDPARVDIELPYSHLEALLYFVASRMHNPVGMTNEFHAGNSYATKYEAACIELEQVNLRVDQGHTNYRLERNGWV